MNKTLLALINVVLISTCYSQNSDEFRTFFYAHLFPLDSGINKKTSQVKIDWYCSEENNTIREVDSNKIKEPSVRIANQVAKVKGKVIRNLNFGKIEFKLHLSKVYWDYQLDSLAESLDMDTTGKVEEMIENYTDSMFQIQLNDAANIIKVYKAKKDQTKIYFQTSNSVILIKVHLKKSCSGTFDDILTDLVDYLCYSKEEKGGRFRYELYKVR